MSRNDHTASVCCFQVEKHSESSIPLNTAVNIGRGHIFENPIFHAETRTILIQISQI